MRRGTFAFVLVAILAVAGCKSVKTEYSAELHEDATIVNTAFTPSRHDVGIGIKAYDVGGISYDYSGNPGIGLGKSGMQISSSTVPEKYAVLFQCQHGRFIIERKEIYDRFNGLEGRSVDVAYREVYQVTHEKQDGVDKVIDRVLTDFDFLNATLK